MIVPPYSSRHCPDALDERLAADRLAAGALATSSFSTCVWVAIPAWSVPRIHFARRPSPRAQRIRQSWIEPLSAWPMCSAPVTFGGGMAIEKFSAGVPSGSGWCSPDSSQRRDDPGLDLGGLEAGAILEAGHVRPSLGAGVRRRRAGG